jgi:hypothetical protein
VSGIVYLNFRNFLINTVYQYYKLGGYKRNYRKADDPKTPPKKEPVNKYESDPIKNRQRRLNLLKQTLDGYERQLRNTIDKQEREQLQNEIKVIKDKIKIMENPKNEKYNHVMSFQLFEKQFNPIKDDYVMITYSLTGEPVPVQIKKVFPNNTYLVSFNVDGSLAKGAPDATIRNSDIISPYKPIKSPVGSGFISSNMNFQVRNTSNVNQVSNDMYL